MSTTFIILLSASTAFAAIAPSYSQAAMSSLAYTTSAATSGCAKDCNELYFKCHAGRAFCASQLEGCLNYMYNPPDATGYKVTPTPCSASNASKSEAASTSATAHPGSYAPSSPTGSASYTPSPYNGLSSHPDCATKCHQASNKCHAAPNADMATCRSQLDDCLYSFDDSGTFVTPAVCSAGASKPTAAGDGTSPAGSDSAPAQYTGGAVLLGGSFMAAAAAAGVFALMD